MDTNSATPDIVLDEKDYRRYMVATTNVAIIEQQAATHRQVKEALKWELVAKYHIELALYQAQDTTDGGIVFVAKPTAPAGPLQTPEEAQITKEIEDSIQAVRADNFARRKSGKALTGGCIG